MPEKPLRDLYLACSLDDLKSKAIMKLQSMILSCNQLMEYSRKVYEKANVCLRDGDQENAYLYFMRYCWCLTELRKTHEYTADPTYYKAMTGTNFKTACDTLDSLDAKLRTRYQMRDMEKSNLEEMVIKNDTNINQNSHETTHYINIGLNKVPQPDSDVVCCRTLYKLIAGGDKSVLILDVRPKNDFLKSHINIKDIINIPPDFLQPGMTVSQLEKHLSADVKSIWADRKKYGKVVLMDWNSYKCISPQPIFLLHALLTKWDRSVNYSGRLKLLEGGYDMWVKTYPASTTNPDVSPPKPTSVNRGMSLSNINYPTTEIESMDVEEDNHNFTSYPYFDRSKKPSIPNKIEDKEREELVDKIYQQHADVNENSKPDNVAAYDDQMDTTEEDEQLDEIEEDIKQLVGRNIMVPSLKRVSENEQRNTESSGGLKRGHSTPNIPQQMQNDDSSGTYTPLIDRNTKPRIAGSDFGDRSYAEEPVYRNNFRAGLIGLRNLGNTCYMNSIIQCLSNTSGLKECLTRLNSHHINEKSKTKGMIAKELRRLINDLWSGESRSISCKALKDIVGEFKNAFRGYDQQDSHEFLTIMLDWLHEDLNIANVEPGYRSLKGADEKSGEKAWGEFCMKNNSQVRHLFYGQQKSTVTCNSCKKESVTFEPFSNISLPIKNDVETCSITDCINLYLTKEDITGWQCPACKITRDATKKLDITRLPPILVLHFKRFTSEPNWCRKRQTLINFPVDSLDMEPYVIGDEHRNLHYSLYAVSNHYGTMDSGHYTAFCKSNNKWYRFDDTDVSLLSDSCIRSPAAYILFYVRT